MKLTRRAFVAASAMGADAETTTGFKSDWRGARIWIGPEYWANPLQDWRTANRTVFAKAGENRTLHRITHRISATGAGSFRTSVRVTAPVGRSNETSAGFRIGIRGLLDDYRHALVSPVHWIDAVVRGDGKLLLDNTESEQKVDLTTPAALELEADSSGRVTLTAGSVRVSKQIPRGRLNGNIALAALTPRDASERPEWRFSNWAAEGSLLTADPESTFGPILWTQYTLSRGILKVTALFPVLGPADSKIARLELLVDGRWRKVAGAEIDPLSRTATFRVERWDARRSVPYRVIYRWQGRDHPWSGRIRSEPSGGKLSLGVFSCDNGYAFPLPRLIASVRKQDPDLLFFAGDQIYEGYGGFGFVREPAELAMLDYLRKFWQFGWTWRELLRDRPSVVIPDDHDVFQGNIWGHGGRKIPKGREKGFVYGGYVEPPEWVNAVQRTQSAHLPDPVDPEPVDQGITVYFTELVYGGVSFAVIEDRKFKTGPEAAFPNGIPRTGNPEVLDVAGADMLGKRQEDFLRRWAASRSSPFKVVLSQTIFCKVTTHIGPALRREDIDLDSGAWPQSGRRRALESVRGANAIMIHGDQHLGALVRHGIHQWEDGPVSFMVPGTANGFPRAWWPDPTSPDGHYFDGLGNRITVLGIANPDRGSNEIPRASIHPETLAHRKGSGWGIVRFDAATRSATFEMWRYLEGQFDGFPQTLSFG
jgi:hypothetical protein